MVATRIDDRVAVVAYDGMTTFEYAVATEVFGLDRPEIAIDYELIVAAAEPGPLRAAFGLVVDADGGLDLLATAGTIIVPGWRDRDERPPEDLLDALVDAHRRGTRLVSICSGAYVLASTGLLDGLDATTHWRYVDHFRRRFPAIRVNPNVLFIDNGTLITSAGSAAGIDTCLEIVRTDWGQAAANEVARRLVVSPLRDGGQAQHISPSAPGQADSGFGRLLGEVMSELDQDHTVASLAKRANMSRRTFQRRFLAEVGTTPSQWLIDRRLDRARTLLETSDWDIERISAAVGYTNAVSLRQQFRRQLDTTPTAYRRRYQAAPRPAG